MSDYFMGTDGFVWFVGVVEDRDDPEYMGRVRVRCLGFHSDNLNKIATEDLPWATVMAPTSSPSMSGLGTTPPFLVEGSWVVGFFRDSREKQQPIILGSLPGFNSEFPDLGKGFSDPNGVYPLQTGEPDTNRLAQGSVQEFHPSLYKRQKLKQTKVPISTKPLLDTVSDAYKDHGGQTDDDGVTVPLIEQRDTWDEPDPKSGGITTYPYNHVHESESGHVIEIDDTPGNERLHTYHNSGTFEEIHSDGTKVTKVVKDNYTIIMGSDRVYIDGAVNLTITGDVRQLIKGNYHLEVEGDYSQKIHQNHYVKIGARGEEDGGGNREEEIVGNHAYNIEGSQNGRVNKDVDTVINGKESRTIGITSDLFVVGDGTVGSETYQDGYTIICLEKLHMVSLNDMSISVASGIMSLKSGTKLNMKSATEMTLHTETSLLETVGTSKVSTTGTTWGHTSVGDIDIDGSRIDLN
ncbi:MAG: hypothetical protein CMO16_07320 [Thaumarchaeota archaeon]|nr:hypothetical protein [Nitrososphaerota archaeon]